MKLEKVRKKIELIDERLVLLLTKRFKLARKAYEIKNKLGLPIKDQRRETEVLEKAKKHAENLKLNKSFISKLFKEIIRESKKIQK